MQDFYQIGPNLKNQYTSDSLLRTFLRWRMPSEVLAKIEPGLIQFGERVIHDVLLSAQRAEAEEPKFIPYSPWGERIDHIEMSEGWGQLHRVAAEEGIVAISYERAHAEWSRVHALVKLYLFHPSSAFYSCPLAMTDGAARALELYGNAKQKESAFVCLTTRNPQRFWTSGQWMTERTGGSDVSRTSTIAEAKGDGFVLSGDKWFTSSTTSQMALTLARIAGDSEGNKGLSLFLVETRDEKGNLNRIRIGRLKEKLGTRAMPTAELTLDQTPATLIGGRGEGVKKIAAMLNITRIYNSVCSLSTMARGLALAKDFAPKRTAFKATLNQHPLHVETLADLQVQMEASFHLTFHLATLLGREEMKLATPDEVAVLRLLTPVLKLWTGKQAQAITSEVIESFGGAGYVEDTGLPRLLRDSQVFSIWEGTTNILSLDTLRAIVKENALKPFLHEISLRIERVHLSDLASEVTLVKKGVAEVQAAANRLLLAGDEAFQASARSVAFSLARLFSASLMLEFAQWCQEQKQRPQSVEVARRFCRSPLVHILETSVSHREASGQLLWGP